MRLTLGGTAEEQKATLEALAHGKQFLRRALAERLQRSDPQGNILNILQELAIIVLSNLSLLMSPLSIAEQCIKGVHGLFREQKLSERLFLCVDNGAIKFFDQKSCTYFASPF